MIKGMLELFGHHVTIQPFYGQGGGIEDVHAWCHTCDPRGAHRAFDAEETGPLDALTEAFEWIDDHVRHNNLYDMSKSPSREFLEDHQVWAGMNGPDAHHWEIRGTGVLI